MAFKQVPAVAFVVCTPYLYLFVAFVSVIIAYLHSTCFISGLCVTSFCACVRACVRCFLIVFYCVCSFFGCQSCFIFVFIRCLPILPLCMCVRVCVRPLPSPFHCVCSLCVCVCVCVYSLSFRTFSCVSVVFCCMSTGTRPFIFSLSVRVLVGFVVCA